MDFNTVVTYYERIAATSKRLEIIQILAELFIECKQPENVGDLRKITYLTQGKLVSDIKDSPKFGIAEKLIIQAVAKFTGMSGTKIKAMVNKKGDVGETVQSILETRVSKKVVYSMDSFTSKSPSSSKVLEIHHLYSHLEKLAAIKGDRSQDLKINVINGILRRCTPQSAKYIINIILSNLRIGFADITILDGLTQAFTGTKDNRSVVQNAYNIHPDLGEIADVLAHDGLEGIRRIKIQVGVPIQMMLASRIQYSQIQQKLGGDDFIAEYKYDGERVQVHKNGSKITLFSRQLKRITTQYPDVVQAVRDQVHAEDAIFEEEIVAMDPFFEQMRPFQVLSTRRRKYNIEKLLKEVPVCLYCFDILYVREAKGPKSTLNGYVGQNVMEKPLLKRREILENIITPSERIQYSTKKTLHSTEEMVTFFQEARSAGAEGIMNKQIGKDAIYKAGNRGFLWIKLKGLEGTKMADTIDVAIIGGSWGKGRRAGMLNPFFGAVYNAETEKFEFLTRVGSGFTEELLVSLTEELLKSENPKKPNNVICSDVPDVWLNPQMVIEIMGDELTQSSKADAGVTHDNPTGLGLRFPVFQRIRDDKSVYQITTTAEILHLYSIQS